MYYPSLDTVKGMATQGNLVPIYREIDADLETPVSAYLKVANSPYSFLLESVEGGEKLARYSFIGTDPYSVLQTKFNQSNSVQDPLVPIQKELGQYRLVAIPELPQFHGGAVGYIAYDAIRHFESTVEIPTKDTLGLPESVFMFVDTILIFDHLRHSIKVVSHVSLDVNIEESYKNATSKIDILVQRLSKPVPLQSRNLISKKSETGSNFKKQEYIDAIEKAKEYIYAGDIIQVVPSQRFVKQTNADPFQIYRALRATNPSPYMYYLDLDTFHVIGASIETLVKVENNHVVTHPIAGTRPRGNTVEEDNQLEIELSNSDKQRAEHIMLVDLARNDIGRVCVPGTVEVTKLMGVERYSRVMHLVSHVEGELRPDLNAYDALRACFPAGTLSGAPKIRAMQIISELEAEKRGPYGGVVGYFGFSGNIDTAIILRTGILKDDMLYVQAGGGVVADSIPEDEYQETLHKAGALFRALEKAEGSAI